MSHKASQPMPKAEPERIGFWRSERPPLQLNLPDPLRLADDTWSLRERVRLAAYLRAGESVQSWMGYSWCRFDCGIPMHQLGTRDLSDGRFLWPEGLHHYVEMHAVRLPKVFMDHVADKLPSLKPWWRLAHWWRKQRIARAISAQLAREREASKHSKEEALHRAAAAGDASQVRALLAAGCGVNVQDSHGMTPLALTRTRGIARMLVDAGATVDPQPAGYITPLQQAVAANDRSWCEYLLERGADINALSMQKRSVLSYCKPSMLDWLLERGADARLGVPLFNAANHGDRAMINRLLEVGADVNGNMGSVTPLMAAIRRPEHSPWVIERLLQAGADIGATDKMGHSALMYAAERLSLKTVQMLIEAGAPLTQRGQRGVNALHMAAIARAKSGNRAEVLACLVKADVASIIDQKDDLGRTPLACAATYGDAASMQVLIEAGADETLVSVPNDDLMPIQQSKDA